MHINCQLQKVGAMQHDITMEPFMKILTEKGNNVNYFLRMIFVESIHIGSRSWFCYRGKWVKFVGTFLLTRTSLISNCTGQSSNFKVTRGRCNFRHVYPQETVDGMASGQVVSCERSIVFSFPYILSFNFFYPLAENYLLQAQWP